MPGLKRANAGRISPHLAPTFRSPSATLFPLRQGSSLRDAADLATGDTSLGVLQRLPIALLRDVARSRARVLRRPKP